MRERITLPLLVLLLCATAVSAVPQVAVSLRSSWEATPLLAEAAEFFGRESASAFYSFVEGLSESAGTTDAAGYEATIAYAEASLDPSQVDLLHFSLSISAESPRVEAKRSLHRTLRTDAGPTHACATATTIVHVGGRIVCSVDDVKAAVEAGVAESDDDTPTAEVLEFDHTYPGTPRHDTPVAVLYTSLGTSEFTAYHSVLAAAASEGSVTYVLRYSCGGADSGMSTGMSKRVGLQGYGVELAIKNMEYKTVDDTKIEGEDESVGGEADSDADISGFLFKTLMGRKPALKSQLQAFRAQLLSDASDDLEAVKPWHMKDLGVLSAQRVLISTDPLAQLASLTGDFPNMAASLTRVPLDEKIQARIQRTHQFINPGANRVELNGRAIDIDTVDPFQLLEAFRAETTAAAKMSALGIPPAEQRKFARMSMDGGGEKVVVDVRSDEVVWLNDLTRDGMYAKWSRSIGDIVRGDMNGFKFVRNNMLNIVLVVDPGNAASLSLIASAMSFQQRQLPARFGVLLVTEDELPEDDDYSITPISDAAIAAKAFRYINKHGSSALAFQYLYYANQLSGRAGTPYKQAYSIISAQLSKQKSWDSFEFEDNEDFWKGQAEALRLGAPPNTVFVNGEVLAGDTIDSTLIRVTKSHTPSLVQAVASGAITDRTNVYDHVMSQPGVLPRFSKYVIPTESMPMRVVAVGRPSGVESDADFAAASASVKVGAVLAHSSFTRCRSDDAASAAAVSHVVFADPGTPAGSRQIRSLLKYFASGKCKSARHTVLFNSVRPRKSRSAIPPGDVIGAALRGAPNVLEGSLALRFARKLTETVAAGERHVADARAVVLAALEAVEVPNAADVAETLYPSDELLAQFRREKAVATELFGFAAGATGWVSNGRVIAVDAGSELSVSDIALLTGFETSQRAAHVVALVDKLGLWSDGETASDVVMELISVLAADGRRESNVAGDSIPAELKPGKRHAGFTIKADPNLTSFDVVAVLDPVSSSTQRFAPILAALRDEFNLNIRVVLNPRLDIGELPLTRIYRYALKAGIDFTPEGTRVPAGAVAFDGLPTKATYTLAMDVSAAWMVEAALARYDLDNIRLSELPEGETVNAVYELEKLLVEGACYDTDGAPPAGLELILGSGKSTQVADTAVMSNLGYFQLPATPGVWDLRLRPGRASEVYEIEGSTGKRVESMRVVVDSFNGAVVPLTVARRPGMEDEILLLDKSGSSWGLFGKGGSENGDDTIHIFSVASGHLYERFLRIMMLSVTKNTDSPVKFWFIKNFLSPKFKASVGYMAEKYGFEVELVSYKWPDWLRGQTEKQRQIWGTKILFLDVLFPLNLSRIIFVDADQIVRADMRELYDMDLNGKVYGFTPFCDSRKETDGFRFWASGYWKNHLGELPYHISALYVVDLKRFRLTKAGDTIRATYQALSADPNSLANLDQDLPNQLQKQVPIHSLPQEWLWCETWCSDESKESAKTIDLCNNPLTKTPKLENAKRIVPEWTALDEEAKAVEKEFEEMVARGEVVGAVAGVSESVGSVSGESVPGHSHDEL